MQQGLIHMGQRLKQILKHKKIKIVDFARMAGFTNQIAHYHLRKSDMKRSSLERFCSLVGITAEEFYNWNNAVTLKTGQGQVTTVAHHGQRFTELIEEKGLNKSKLARRLDMSRKNMYDLFEKAAFDPLEMESVTKALEVTESTFLHPNMVTDVRIADSEEMLAMREKYYRLLEDYNQLLKQHNALKETLDTFKKDIVQLRKQARPRKV
ncbi:helix-turn-helix domain-containing protein [Chitinophaga japonensis]|uniref:Helix-turn-helix protein n=1 Tax=Chitinophaga japonensis TaxID=104662 RepID=A0A562TET9_CHIJA|nr:helix-turn-helix domain-containing protein [Chitinophaga japonensis]TWI91903.1 helix-turn-helix protein [Chitinophaga japonensis]